MLLASKHSASTSAVFLLLFLFLLVLPFRKGRILYGLVKNVYCILFTNIIFFSKSQNILKILQISATIFL